MKKEIEILLKRAEGFMIDAMEDYKRGDYDLAMFHIEHACQLLIKAKLLNVTGYFDKTHSLRKLLKDLSSFFKGGNRGVYRRKLERFEKLGIRIYSFEILTRRVQGI